MTAANGIGLHLVLPPGSAFGVDPGEFASQIAHLLDAVPVASAEIAPPPPGDRNGTGSDSWRRGLDVLRPAVQDRGVALLARIVGADVAPASSYRTAGLDGVMVGNAGSVREVRALLGPTDIVGCIAGPVSGDRASARHDAMIAGETGADVVAFEIDGANPDPEENGLSIVRWWAEMMEVPCIAAIPPTTAAATAARDAGAEFVGLDERLWAGAEDLASVIDRLAAINRTLNLSR